MSFLVNFEEYLLKGTRPGDCISNLSLWIFWLSHFCVWHRQNSASRENFNSWNYNTNRNNVKKSLVPWVTQLPG